MRFMVMHKMTEELERGGPPDRDTTDAVRKLIAKSVEDKIFVSGEGLKPTSERTHVAYKGGKRTVTDGPFTEAKELVAGYAIMRVQSKDEALIWCDKFAALLGDVELFMGPLIEAWDLGLAPKPEKPPLRILSMHSMPDSDFHDLPPDVEMMQRMGALIEEMTKAGVMQETNGLSSTKHGARIHYAGGKRTVVDGPFAESKELVAGYCIIDVPSKAAAIEWATRFGDIVKVHEVEVRQVPEW
ncbi:MAG TPA: YciI family protein [Polyangiaceae bacterium]|nr:YciI family protein [Polyangiaceae bacterium]